MKTREIPVDRLSGPALIEMSSRATEVLVRKGMVATLEIPIRAEAARNRIKMAFGDMVEIPAALVEGE